MITVAGGIILAAVILGALGAAWGGLASLDDRPESDHARARREARSARLAAKLAAGPCYVDRWGMVRQGLRRWDWS